MRDQGGRTCIGGWTVAAASFLGALAFLLDRPAQGFANSDVHNRPLGDVGQNVYSDPRRLGRGLRACDSDKLLGELD